MTNEIIKTENLNGNEIDRLLICAIRCALHSSVQSFCLFPSMNVDSCMQGQKCPWVEWEGNGKGKWGVRKFKFHKNKKRNGFLFRM